MTRESEAAGGGIQSERGERKPVFGLRGRKESREKEVAEPVNPISRLAGVTFTGTEGQGGGCSGEAAGALWVTVHILVVGEPSGEERP